MSYFINLYCLMLSVEVKMSVDFFFKKQPWPIAKVASLRQMFVVWNFILQQSVKLYFILFSCWGFVAHLYVLKSWCLSLHFESLNIYRSLFNTNRIKNGAKLKCNHSYREFDGLWSSQHPLRTNGALRWANICTSKPQQRNRSYCVYRIGCAVDSIKSVFNIQNKLG